MRISDWSSDVCSSDLMDNDLVVERRFHRAGDGAFIGGTTIGGDTIYVYGLIGHAARNPAVNHIHHAANRRRSIEQGGGATQDLYPVCCKRIDDNGMID